MPAHRESCADQTRPCSSSARAAPARSWWRAPYTRRAAAHGARFVAINCAAIPEQLLESELFGYEKGAFTGAGKTTPGKIELASGGTLLLDEIGDMPLPLQAKLLRFLQDHVIERVGGRQEIPVDVRIVCATNKDLQALITENKFRQDLYFRIGEVTIEVPPLRERKGGPTALAHTMLRKFAGAAGQAAARIHAGGHRRARGLRLAGQCPRTRESREDRDDHGRERAAHRRRPQPEGER